MALLDSIFAIQQHEFLLEENAFHPGLIFPNGCAENSPRVGLAAEHQKKEVSRAQQCVVCCFSWTDRDDQIEHYRSDWHRFNLKRSLENRPTLSEQEFEQFSDDSASASCTESETELDPKNAVQVLRQRKLQQDAMRYFLGPDKHVYGMYKCIFSVDLKNAAHQISVWQKFPWIVMLMSGGRFAGAVFQGQECIEHKAIQRYTVRKKQGGSQGAHDAAGGMAQSAGAALRRYNERALLDEVSELLTESWKDCVSRAQFVFIRCASFHKKVFFGGQKPIFAKNDSRLRQIPFLTHRPTFEEVKRVHKKLTSCVCCGLKEQFLASLVANEEIEKAQSNIEKENAKRIAYKKSAKNSTTKGSRDGDRKTQNPDAVTAINKITTETEKQLEVESLDTVKEDGLSQRWKSRFYTVIKSGKREAFQATLRDYIEENSSPTDLLPLKAYLNQPFGSAKKQTFLHVVLSDYDKVEKGLLSDVLCAGADPCAKNAAGQVAFQSCPNRTARNEFIEFRRNFPSFCDWDAAQVPEPLDLDVLAAKEKVAAEKRKAARKIRKEKLKEKKAEQKILDEEEAERNRFLALSDREKRAVAAERRIMKEYEQNTSDCSEKPVMSRCFFCAADITGKVPFEYSDNRFCSVGCLKKHRNACGS